MLCFTTFLFANTQVPLYVVFPKNFPPHYYYENERPSGFAHDVFNYIKEDIDLKVKLIPQESWPELWKRIKKDEFDIIPDMGITEQRSKYVDFSDPFEVFHISLYATVLKDYKTLEDLNKKKVAVVKQNAAIKYLEKNYPQIILISFNTKEEAFTSLISGRVEAFAYPEPGTEYMINLFGANGRVKKVTDMLEIKRAVAIKKGNKELLEKINHSIKKLLASSEYQKIFSKWHEGELLKKYTQKELNQFVYIAVGIFLFLFSLLFYIVKVNNRLKDEIEKRVILQKELEEKNISLNLAQSIAKLGSWEDDIINQTQVWSDEIYDLFGLKQGEVKPSTEEFMKYVHSEDKEYLLNEYKKAMFEKKDFKATYKIVSKNKKLIYVEARGRIFYNEAGVATKSVGSIYDVTHRVLSRQEIEEKEFKLRFAMEGNGDGFWEWNRALDKFYFSSQWKAIIGYKDSELENKFETWESRVHPEDIDRTLKLLQEHVDGKSEKYINEHRVKCKDGSYKWILTRGISMERDDKGKTIKMIGTHTDTTEHKNIQERLELSASVFTYAKEGIILTDKHNKIIDVNDSFSQISGFEKSEVIKQNPSILNSGRHDKLFYKYMWDSLTLQGYWHGEIWNRRKDGEIYPELLTISTILDENEEVKNYVAIFSDISSQKRYQQRLEFLAHNDPLTKLPNRVLFSDRLNQAIVKSVRNSKKIAIIYIDLDGFKEVNDTYGHDVGDELLVKISAQMNQVLRQSDTLARLGGDEFVLVLNDLDETKDSIHTIQRVLSVTSSKYEINQQSLQVSASAGVTFYPQNTQIDADHLIRQADQAMYKAKVLGKNRYHIFDEKEDKDVREYYQEVENIKKAMENDEFQLYYQPKVCIKTGTVVGLEALIRWVHPEKGLMLPFKFLPIIENHEFSIELGEWVIRTALEEIRALKKQGHCIPISVNVSAYQIQDIKFTSRLEVILKSFPDINPKDLEIEIVETSMLEDLDDTANVIKRCKNAGVTMALDDFGTGYSSLAYLRSLDIDTVKIDKSFIMDILNSHEDETIVEGIILLSKSFDRKVIAEGVEIKEHLNVLKKLGCNYAQGFYIAKPMPQAEVIPWLESWSF